MTAAASHKFTLALFDQALLPAAVSRNEPVLAPTPLHPPPRKRTQPAGESGGTLEPGGGGGTPI